MSTPSIPPAAPDAAPQPVGPPAGVADWYPDPVSGRLRWWDGKAWTPNYKTNAPQVAGTTASNQAAILAWIFGVLGFLVMFIPFFYGLIIGGVLDVVGIVFGIVGLTNAGAKAGFGRPWAITGIVLGGLSLIAAAFGNGWLW